MLPNSKNEEVALLLIQRGAPLSATKKGPRVTALQSAAANGCLKVVRRLAMRYRELIHGPLVTPGHKADVGRPPDPAAADSRGNTAMHYLALCSRRDYVHQVCLRLMDLGVPLDTPWGGMAMSPLLMACALGNFTVASEFVRFGANLLRRDPTQQERQQNLQEHILPEHRQANAAYVYTALGATYKRAKQAGVVWQSGGKARWEVERRNFIREFIQHNGKVHYPVSLAGDTALARAADRGYVEEIRILVAEGGAVIDRPDAFGMTPLCKAALRGHTAAVEVGLRRVSFRYLSRNEHPVNLSIGTSGTRSRPKPSQSNRSGHRPGADQWHDRVTRNRANYDLAFTLWYACGKTISSDSPSV